LLFDSLRSIYYNFIDEKNLSERPVTLTEDPQFLDTIHKNIADTIHVIATRRTISRKRFCVIEEAILPKWRFLNNEQIIHGYKCKLAKASINGVTYLAWYTLEINFPFGPNKLGGLPGIVLELFDEKKEIFHLLAYEIKLTSDKMRKQSLQPKCSQPILSKIFQEILQKEINEHNSRIMDIINNGTIKQNNQF
jgi:GLPGLI family protein